MTTGGWFIRLAAVAVAFTLMSAAGAQAAVRQGLPAPEISGRTLETNEPITLSGLRGKWVYVDFWASWCKPCMRELPNVIKLHRDMQSNPEFAVLAVSLDSEGTLGQLRKVVKKNGITYPIVYTNDGCSAIAGAWGVRSIPSTYLVDPQGNIVGEDISISQVRSLIEERGPDPGQSRYGDIRQSERPKARPVDTVPARQPSALGANYSLKPVQVQCTQQLLPSQTGMQGAHDLEVTMALDQTGPKLRNYRMFLRATKRGKNGQPVDAIWRYDINLLLDPRNRHTPYFIEINDSSDPGKALGYPAPDLTAMIDIERGVCQFIVPLAPDTQKLNYAMAYYDPNAR
jgi:thiol-disulfide isomerase/thioredoxin